MATKKITDLTAITSLASTDVLPAVGIGTNTTYKITVQNLASSLTQVTSSISASYAATASIATSSSYALSASNARSSSFAISSSYSVSSSFITLAQTASYVQTAQTASYVVLAQTASFVTTAQTASFVATASWARNAVTASYVQNAQTASYVLNAVTASFVALAQTASYVSGQIHTSTNPALTASNALTASSVNTLVQNVAITGSLVVSGSNGAGVFSQGATIADYITGIYNSASYAVWRSPFSCSVVAMYGYREGGGTSQINAFKSGSTGYLLHTGSNISLDVAYAWKKSNTITNTDYAPGDSLFVVISGSQGNNQIAVQVDFIRKF